MKFRREIKWEKKQYTQQTKRKPLCLHINTCKRTIKTIRSTCFFCNIVHKVSKNSKRKVCLNYSAISITRHHKSGVDSKKCYCILSHRLRKKNKQMIASVNRLRWSKTKGEPGEEHGPDEAWGYCPAGGRNWKSVLWWKN